MVFCRVILLIFLEIFIYIFELLGIAYIYDGSVFLNMFGLLLVVIVCCLVRKDVVARV